MKREMRIGVLVDMIVRLGREVAAGVASYGHLADWELLTQPIWRVTDRTLSGLFDADGIIFSAYGPDIVEQALLRKMPVVNVSNMLVSYPMPSVLVDSAAIGRLAAEHLMDTGAKTLAVDVAYRDQPLQWAIDRAKAFVDAGRAAGLPIYASGLDFEGLAAPIPDPSHDAHIAWLRTLPRQVGIFACNDQNALDVLHDCRQAGLSVPDDATVLGCDNDELLNRFAKPAMSSIMVDFERQGYLAAELLDRQLQGERVKPNERIMILPSGVMRRASTETLSIDDPDVAQAMKFIIDNVRRAIGVNDVVAATGVSRRTLETRFRSARGRSLLQEIIRVRIERAKRLLTETQLKLDAVARECGFGSRVRLSIVFKELTRVSPEEWRKSHGRPRDKA